MSKLKNNTLRLRHRIAFKQARFVVLVALLLGFLFSVFQSYVDYGTQKAEFAQTIQQVIATTKQTASKAAYFEDVLLANQVAEGLLQYQPIIGVYISADYGGGDLSPPLANKARTLQNHQRQYQFLPSRLFGGVQNRIVDLFAFEDTQNRVGIMKIVTDSHNLEEAFIERSVNDLVANVVRAGILAFIVLIYFYYTMSRPLEELSRTWAEINPENPERTRLSVSEWHRTDEFAVLVAGANGFLDAMEKHLQLLEVTDGELKKHQNELLQLKKMESIGSLTAGIAHNLNNFLHPIGIYGEILLEKFPDDCANRDAIQSIISSCDQASNLVSHLMAYSRQESGGKRESSIYPVIEQTLALMRPTIPATTMLYSNLDEDTGIVEMNTGQIKTAVMNLLSNAVDALQGNIGNVTITLEKTTVANGSIEDAPSYACITIADTGTGMSDETIDRMFDPFYTTKDVGKGTGLGLSTVYGTIRDHGGTIGCTSAIGKGTTFIVQLPLKEMN